jgi:hypothetical protein
MSATHRRFSGKEHTCPHREGRVVAVRLRKPTNIMITKFKSYNKCMAGSTPKFGVPNFAMHQTLCESFCAYMLEVFMLKCQFEVDHVEALLLRHVGTIPEAFVRIKTALAEAQKSSPNSDYTQCARDIIASVMYRCAEPAEVVIAEYLKAHFA